MRRTKGAWLAAVAVSRAEESPCTRKGDAPAERSSCTMGSLWFATARWRAVPSSGERPTACTSQPGSGEEVQRWAPSGIPAPQRPAGRTQLNETLADVLVAQLRGNHERRAPLRDGGACQVLPASLVASISTSHKAAQRARRVMSRALVSRHSRPAPVDWRRLMALESPRLAAACRSRLPSPVLSTLPIAHGAGAVPRRRRETQSCEQKGGTRSGSAPV